MEKPKLASMSINVWEVIGNGGSRAMIGTRKEADEYTRWLEAETGQTVIVIPFHLCLATNSPTDIWVSAK